MLPTARQRVAASFAFAAVHAFRPGHARQDQQLCSHVCKSNAAFHLHVPHFNSLLLPTPAPFRLQRGDQCMQKRQQLAVSCRLLEDPLLFLQSHLGCSCPFRVFDLTVFCGSDPLCCFVVFDGFGLFPFNPALLRGSWSIRPVAPCAPSISLTQSFFPSVAPRALCCL